MKITIKKDTKGRKNKRLFPILFLGIFFFLFYFFKNTKKKKQTFRGQSNEDLKKRIFMIFEQIFCVFLFYNDRQKKVVL